MMKTLTMLALAGVILVDLFHARLRRSCRRFLAAIADARRGRRVVRYRVRRPIRSSRNDAKRTAQQFASDYAGRDLSWKAARKLLKRLERKLEPERA
jgi:hypothetical protein